MGESKVFRAQGQRIMDVADIEMCMDPQDVSLCTRAFTHAYTLY
jgi:hypothetical protein